MQTNLAANIQKSAHAADIESILRKCVHCGFCNATCPTYQIRGDELDGPRGRIYQMKQFFEGESANAEMMLHLDRCLTCRSCETTCPSGVHYSRLLEYGREAIEAELPRPLWQQFKRWAIVRFINSGVAFEYSIKVARLFAPVLPSGLRASIPSAQPVVKRTVQRFPRKVLMLSGCVQPVLTPNTNIHSNNLLNRLGIEVIELPGQQCCGAAAMHSSAQALGRNQARRLIDEWWPQVESGVEAILVTATGCGITVKDYAHLFSKDDEYGEKAARISALFCDLSEYLVANADRLEFDTEQRERVAFHTPCSMQHGLKINGTVEGLLRKAGYQLCQVADAHLCCGSAGTYSMLQPELSGQLRANKQRSLGVDSPDIIASANVGCQLQLAQGSETPVVHWIELIARAVK